MLSIEEIKQALQEADLKVLKSLGQNFLTDEQALRDIVSAAELGPEEVVVEIGPGMGALTFALAAQCERVIAIEKDKKMGRYLRQEVAKRGSEGAEIEVISDDILKINLPEFLAVRGIDRYKLVANIPYYITSAIIKLFLETENKPEEMVLLVQKEVAERICARPGDLSVLALSVLLYGEPELVRSVPASAFYPEPKVDSAVLRIRAIGKRYKDADYNALFRLIKIGFAAKRKKLSNNLAAGLGLSKEEAEKIMADCGIDRLARAQDLEVADWVKLRRAIGD